ncbi:MAG: amidohydrolase family protein [Armatimonadota bacterium]|nr:amidohydrolase family protein [Armatimonadota bacterium]MDR7402706.1 amidohydrolase family protein [Armatimonadota bacterium]MDR7403519.1 amidohydrolase family protein [Armatimonadota bacterium]MDR7506498.1 amidohydrolase family protein [Armatimonadota bacterium]MDR7509863.1 amidohydrolase family protein [Armatimonadota bacterium]
MSYTTSLASMDLPEGESGELLIRGGRVVDPARGVDAVADVAVADGRIQQVADGITPGARTRVVEATGLVVAPGLIDLHCHLYDLFDVSTTPAPEAVAAGVTVALTPGAGNTLMTPALLGAEVDRGLPLSVGCLLGAAAVLGTRASVSQLIAYFRGELAGPEQAQVITRNPITNATGSLVVGLKDHMGHWILSDDDLEACFQITSAARLLFMSHCQDPEHAERVVRASRGRTVLLTHATAAASGTHGNPVESLQRVLALARTHPWIRVDFTTAHLRPSRGLRDGLLIDARAQVLALQAVADRRCLLLTSDGPCNATMKGFGDVRENVPCLLELAERGVLSLADAVATMTWHPARFLSEVTGEGWWTRDLGHLGPGARANVVLIEPRARRVVMTIVNGRIAAFEGRPLRTSYGAGRWVTRTGLMRLGVGDLPLFSRPRQEPPRP